LIRVVAAIEYVPLGKVGRQLDALVRVLDSLVPGTEFGVTRRAVAVELVRLLVHPWRPALERLRVVLHRLWEILRLERLVALLLLLRAQRHVDVRVLLGLLQGTLGLVQPLQRVGAAMLR